MAIYSILLIIILCMFKNTFSAILPTPKDTSFLLSPFITGLREQCFLLNSEKRKIAGSGCNKDTPDPLESPEDAIMYRYIKGQTLVNLSTYKVPRHRRLQGVPETSKMITRAGSSSRNPVIDITRAGLSSRNPVNDITRARSSSRNPIIDVTRARSSSRNPVIDITRAGLSSRNPVTDNTRAGSSSRNPVIDITRAGLSSCNSVIDIRKWILDYAVKIRQDNIKNPLGNSLYNIFESNKEKLKKYRKGNWFRHGTPEYHERKSLSYELNQICNSITDQINAENVEYTNESGAFENFNYVKMENMGSEELMARMCCFNANGYLATSWLYYGCFHIVKYDDQSYFLLTVEKIDSKTKPSLLLDHISWLEIPDIRTNQIEWVLHMIQMSKMSNPSSGKDSSEMSNVFDGASTSKTRNISKMSDKTKELYRSRDSDFAGITNVTESSKISASEKSRIDTALDLTTMKGKNKLFALKDEKKIKKSGVICSIVAINSLWVAVATLLNARGKERL